MNPRQAMSQLLIVGVFHSSLLVAGSGDQGTASPEVDLKRRIELFGVGADLKLRLTNGESVRGLVETIGEDAFTVQTAEESASRQIAFADLKKAQYPKRGYKAEGTPDPVAARRMVVQLGVGEHIMVKVSPTEKVRGLIRDIRNEHFVVLPDGKTSPVRVPYDSVWKVNKNLSFGATLAIVTLIAATVVLVLVLTGEEDVNVLPD